LTWECVPVPEQAVLMIADTGVRRQLGASAYNERRAQCESAARFFGVRTLRDVDPETFQARAAGLDPLTRRRARHIISENERVLQTVAAMRRHDPLALGELLDASHLSLRDDFEVSSEALDAIVSIARGEPGCFGARMTGAGFGGCAVALVRAEDARTFSGSVAEKYRRHMHLTPKVYLCQPEQGASLENLP
jgi:galactokinase